jgi:hypothetical protein
LHSSPESQKTRAARESARTPGVGPKRTPPTRLWPAALALLGLAWADARAAEALAPGGEALLEALRDRIASGQGGEEGYQEALRMLAADPEGGCADWLEGGEADADGDPAFAESLRAVCPEADAEAPPVRRAPGGPALDLAASQSAYPRADGPAPARWSMRGRDAGAEAEVSGRGAEGWRRWARAAAGGFAAQAGHLGRFLEPTRIACVAGNAAYAGEGGSAGISGPLASGYPGLDGLALSARAGPWRAQAAGAWNRLADARLPGNLKATERRDAGLLAAGLAHAPAEGPETRAQAMLLRLESGSAAPTWIAVAGMQAAERAGAWSGRAAAAVSAGPGRDPAARCGAYAEAALAYRDPEDAAFPDGDAPDPAPARWRLRVRQAFREWADPLQSPRGNLQDTLGGWGMEAPGSGGARCESSFPLARSGGYAAGLGAAAAADWAGAGADARPAEAGLTSGRGEAALFQAYGPFTWTIGGGLGWRRPGSGAPSAGGWAMAGEWRNGPWGASASLSRRGSDYAGSRPMPLELSLARAPARRQRGPSWSLAWSAADARRPGRAQRIDLRQSWPAGNGMRVEQKLRLPWTPDGVARDLAYQLGLEAGL